jgi:putative oxidoreductase
MAFGRGMKPGTLLMSLGKRRLVFFFRLLIGGLFLYAGLSKIGEPYKFAAAIQAYQFLPQFLVGLAAVVIPWIETVGALALLFGWKPRSALVIFILLLVFFVAIIGFTMFRGLDIDCGCGLLSDRKVGWLVLIEDLTLLLVISWLYFMLLPPFPDLFQKPQQ